MQAALAVIPVIALVLLGHLARRGGLIPAASWPGIEQLGYRVLFPAILLTSIYRSELSLGRLGPYLGAMALAFAATGALALIWAARRDQTGPRSSSLFQGALRVNSLLILAVAAQGLGGQALGDVIHRRLCAVNNAEAVGDERVGQLRQLAGERPAHVVVLARLALVEADVLQDSDVAVQSLRSSDPIAAVPVTTWTSTSWGARPSSAT